MKRLRPPATLVPTQAIPAYIAWATKQAGLGLTIGEFVKIVDDAVESSCRPEDREKYRQIAVEAANAWLHEQQFASVHFISGKFRAVSARDREPPLSRVARVLKLFVTRRHYENVISQQIADIQYEYAGARRAGRIWEARMIIARGYASLLPKPFWLWLWALATRAYDMIFRT